MSASQGCTFLDWGADLTAMNAAVFIQPQARARKCWATACKARALASGCDGTQDVSVIGNRIQGDTSVRSQDRGNGIHLYAVHGARVIDNHVRDTRDGIYIDTSNGNLLQGNILEDLRYGIHYMFANDNQVLATPPAAPAPAMR